MELMRELDPVLFSTIVSIALLAVWGLWYSFTQPDPASKEEGRCGCLPRAQ